MQPAPVSPQPPPAGAVSVRLRRRRRRLPWPRRDRERLLWAAGVVIAPAVFGASVAALATLVPFFAICAAAPSWTVRRHSRWLFRHSLRLSIGGIGLSTVSIVSLAMVLGLAARGAARGTFAATGTGVKLLR